MSVNLYNFFVNVINMAINLILKVGTVEKRLKLLEIPKNMKTLEKSIQNIIS